MGESLQTSKGRAADTWVVPARPKLRADVSVRTAGNSDLHELQAPGSPAVCTLYELEFKVARLLDGRPLAQVVEAGRAQGLPITRELLDKFLRQLAAYDLLEGVEGAAGKALSAAKAFLGDTQDATVLSPAQDGNWAERTAPFSIDVVSGAWTPPERPKLHKNLQVRRVEKGRSILFEVSNPRASSTCTLYEIEHSVAQLMDGRRTLDNIVEESVKLGLPMTVEQLVKFIRQLSAYKLIENAAPLPPLFSTALPEDRLARPTRDQKSSQSPEVTRVKGTGPVPANARSRDFEATAVTSGMLADVQVEQLSSAEFYSIDSAPTKLSPDELAAAASPPSAFAPGIPMLTDPRLIRPAVKEEARRALQGDDKSEVSEASKSSSDVRSPWKLAQVAVVSLVLMAGAGLVAIRVPVHVTQKCSLVALDRTVVKAPASGTVSEVLVSVGQKVKQGEVLMRLSQGRGGRAIQKELDELKRLQAEVDEAGDSKPKDVASLRRKVTLAQKEAFAARRAADSVEKLAKRKKASARQVSEAKERLKTARQDLEDARRRLATAKEGGSRGGGDLKQKRERLETLRASVEKAKRGTTEVRSPVDGTVLAPAPENKLDADVDAGDELLAVGDPSRLGVQLRVTGEHIEVGAPAIFVPKTGASHDAKVTVSAPPQGAGPNTLTVSVVLVDPKGVKAGDSGELSVLAGKRSLLNSLLR